MEVLVISPKTAGIGGVAYHTSKLIEYLEKKGVEVKSISVGNTPYLNVKNLMTPSFAITSSIKVIFQRAWGCRFDIVHAHNLASALSMKLSNGKKVLTSHGIFSEQIHSLHGGFLGNLAGYFEKKSISWADSFTVVSRSTEDFYKKLGFKVHYVPNALDFNDLPREQITLYENQIIYVGRLSYEKGVDLLVEVAKQLPSLNFLLIGNGPLYNSLRKAMKEFGNLHLLGYKPRLEALKYLAGSKLFVLPSRNEGLSTAVLEAMALHIPVVATAVGGNQELVVDGVTGFLAKSGDANSIVKAINAAIEGSSRRVVDKAYVMASESYNWNTVVESYLRLYNSML